MTLYIFRGLPGSGKSTTAREMQKALGGRVVERDEIRFMLFGRYVDCDEKLVTETQNTLIDEGLRMRENVFVSDMNLRNSYVKRLIEKAWTFNAQYEIVDLTNVSLEVCISRNNYEERWASQKVVPDGVIIRNYEKFIANKPYPLPVLFTGAMRPDERRFEPYNRRSDAYPAIIVDIDGTIAHMIARGPFDEHLVSTDAVDYDVRTTVLAHHAVGHTVIFMSGRTDGCWDDTVAWLKANVSPHVDPRDEQSGFKLFMRRSVEDRGRPDDNVKYDLFKAHVEPYFSVIMCYDDRDKVVKMWREIGVKCAQVEYGAF